MQIKITKTARHDLDELPAKTTSRIGKALADDERANDDVISLTELDDEKVKVLRLPAEKVAVLYKEADDTRTVLTIVPIDDLMPKASRDFPILLAPSAPRSIKIGHEVLSKVWDDTPY